MASPGSNELTHYGLAKPKWHQGTWSTLVQEMACRLLSVKPLPEPIPTYQLVVYKM